MRTWIAGAMLAVLSLSAQAYEFTFTAEVTGTDGSLSGVSQGTVFSGRFVGNGPYDPYAQYGGFGGVMSAYSFTSGQVTASIAGHSVVAGSPSIGIYDNMGGNVEDGFSMSSGYPMTVDGTTYASGAFGFNLTTVPGNTGVINGLGLPSSVDAALFDGHFSLTYGYMQRDGGQTGRILGFKVLSVTMAGAVPEAGTEALMGLGLAAVALAARRRAQRAA